VEDYFDKHILENLINSTICQVSMLLNLGIGIRRNAPKT